MNKTLLILAGLIGAGIGAAVTYICIKDKVQQKFDDEVESVKRYYESKVQEEESSEKVEESIDMDPVVNSYTSTTEKEVVKKKPFLITWDDFKDSSYDTETLTLYSNGILVNDTNRKKVKTSLVGMSNLRKLNSDNDVIYVRNENNSIDYEILYDLDVWEDS